MSLYFYYSGLRKYALEAFLLLSSLNAIASEKLVSEILNRRFVNTQSGDGQKIPTDLYMEHL